MEFNSATLLRRSLNLATALKVDDDEPPLLNSAQDRGEIWPWLARAVLFRSGGRISFSLAMNMPAKSIISILFTSALCALSQSTSLSPSTAQPSVSGIATSFTNYEQITKSVVFVNPELAMLCRGASKEEVDAARIKFGHHANTGILIYMNKLAAEAFGTNTTAFPVGAVVVKQKTIHGYFDKAGKHVREADTGVGGMVKRAPGYDPAHCD
jgi:hypothetical protein